MARRLKNAARITIQMVIESPDEVVMMAEAPIVEFPGKLAHEVIETARQMHGVMEEDFTDFVNFANDKIQNWVEERRDGINPYNDWP
jgi:DNA-binding transcriptional regulator YiaG